MGRSSRLFFFFLQQLSQWPHRWAGLPLGHVNTCRAPRAWALRLVWLSGRVNDHHISPVAAENGVIRGHSNPSVTPLAPLFMHECSPRCRCAQTQPEWPLCLSQNDSLMSHLLRWNWAWFPRSARSPSSVFFSCFAPWMRNFWALRTGHVVFSWLYGSHLTLSPANRQKAHPPLSDTQIWICVHPATGQMMVFRRFCLTAMQRLANRYELTLMMPFFAKLQPSGPFFLLLLHPYLYYVFKKRGTYFGL